ncbi:hypothetical protein MNBD_DELTA01-690 [hydrothermal vent metagenome]|uniref:Cytochrome c domain-containing protein n=1 Tax=hydrothermal vent metagenome TaxID=652676 RepID=A0A3B0RI21_9ZZZZ
MIKKTSLTCLSMVLFLIAVVLMPSVTAAQDASDGKGLYQTHCMGCHGQRGDGVSDGAKTMVVKPRDFTKGIFKFKSTPQGTLPTDADLMQTISRGLSGSMMPSFASLPEQDRRAILKYIKGFSSRWKTEEAGEPLIVPKVPEYVDTKRSRRRGKRVYFGSGGCMVCHGTKGDGRGAMSESLVDTWGNAVKPADFTKGVYRAGGEPEDLFRTLKTGVEGTAMPSFMYILRDEDVWNIISYLRSLKMEE